MTWGFVVLSLVVSFWQRPGWATSDTKIDLHVDPLRFLPDVASAWTFTTDLGEVHSAQYSGYLWPMGPFFALFHELGLSSWVVQRLWYALLLALAAWGMLRLLDALLGRPRGVAHLVATAVFVLNPYVVVFTSRTSITLLGYAALPWLLLVVYRGIRRCRGRGSWWWPGAFALIFTSIGGGVNAAVVGWMCLGPLVLLLYEPAMGHVRWRDSLSFLWRAFTVSVVVSAWWIVPLLVHVKYGIDFLQFTEQPRTIWDTNSITESLRLMGYWTSYIGVGFSGVRRPFFSDGGTFLFAIPVLLATLALPALATVGLAWTRRWRYASLFLALLLAGIIVMAAGFPNGTPLRGGMLWVYEHVVVLRFMRTVNKAAPLVALGLSGLLGLAAHEVWARLRARAPGRGRTAALVLAPVAVAALLVMACWPLFKGEAIDKQLTWKSIPTAWRDAAKGLDRDLPANTRAMVLPGQIFGYYTWGGSLDAILPRLTDKPVAVRYETPYSDLHAVDALVAADNLIQQSRGLPGQLQPFLGLLGVGAVVTGSDDDLSRSGAVAPGLAAGGLAAQGLGVPTHRYGPRAPAENAIGELQPTVRLPQVRTRLLSGGRGMVHVAPTSPATVVDGSADGLLALAAFGQLPAVDPILYAGDLTTAQLRRQSAVGARVVVSDSNRRRTFLPQYTQQDLGATLTVQDVIGRNSAVLNPFPDRGSAAQTVSVLRGVRAVHAPENTGFSTFPEHRPFAAIDGRTDTSWLVDRTLAPSARWIDVTFDGPTDVPYVDVLPANGPRGVVTAVEVNGRTVPVGLGWTRVPVGAKGLRKLRVRIAGVRQPADRDGTNGGLRELRIPGVHATELLRPPVLAARALAGTDLRHTELTYLFQRTTGDDPYRRDPVTGDAAMGDTRNRGDAERTIDRLLFAPAARRYAVDAWVHPAATAPDPDFDRLAGTRGSGTFTSSSRFHGFPGYRASSAFDGDASTAWIGVIVPGETPAPWIAWNTATAVPFDRVQLTPAKGAVRRPTAVRLTWAGGRTGVLPVAADGTVRLGRTVRARQVRLTVVRSAFPASVSAAGRRSRAVGIATLRVPGVSDVHVPRSGALSPRCGEVLMRVGGRLTRLQVRGTLAQLDAGVPLSATGCDGSVAMGSGVQEVHGVEGPFSVDLLSLRSAAPRGLPAQIGGGRVTDTGTLRRSSWDNVQVALRGPSWLVMGQSFDEGWRATCSGHDLGAPRVVDGYANGWVVGSWCKRASFSFSPQRSVQAGYLLSGVAIVLVIAMMLLTLRRRVVPAVEPRFLAEVAAPARLSPLVAALVALLTAVPAALVFGLRTGPFVALGIFFVLWRPIGARALALAAGVLLGVVVPLLYLLTPTKDEGGFNFGFSVDLINAHWVGVAAIVLLCAALCRMIAAARAARRQDAEESDDSSATSTARAE